MATPNASAAGEFRRRWSWLRWLGHFAEMAFLSVLVLESVGAIRIETKTWLASEGIFALAQFLKIYAPVSFTLLLILLSSRVCRTRGIFLACSFLFAFALLVLLPAPQWMGGLDYMRRELEGVPLPPEIRLGIPIPTSAMGYSILVTFLLPALCGLFFVRLRYRWWNYSVGWVIGFLGVCAALRFPQWIFDLRAQAGTAMWPWESGGFIEGFWRELVLTGLFAEGIRWLPLQRRAVERLTGIALSSKSAPSPVTEGIAVSLAGYAALLVLLAILLVGSVSSYYLARFQSFITHGPPAVYFSPALTNAYDILKERFLRKGQEQLALSINSSQFNEADAALTRNSQLKVWTPKNRKALDRALAEAALPIDDFFKASRADYCLFNGPGRPIGSLSFINARVVSNLFLLQAMRLSAQGERGAALETIATLLRITRLFNTDPNNGLVEHMIAVAIRGFAVAGLQKHYMFWRGDAAAMDEMAEFLEANASEARVSFPWEILKRTEPAFGPVIPAFEISAPGFVKAFETYNRRWAQYDEMRLLVALERHRRDHGAYPAALADLAPAYLKSLPKEPFEGKNYLYENLGDDVQIQIEYLVKANRKNFLSPILAHTDTTTSATASRPSGGVLTRGN